MSPTEIELDGAGEHASRQLSALLSAAMAAAQSAAQLAADRARRQAAAADQQARQTDRATQQQHQAQLAAQRQADRQWQVQQSVQHKQWALQPSAQWLHDNPLSAASAWASADAHRSTDPVAARHAEQWETVFTREGIDLADVRANAAAATTEPGKGTNPGLAADTELTGNIAAADVAGAAVIAGAVDVAQELAHHQHQTAAAAAPTATADLLDAANAGSPPSAPAGNPADQDPAAAASTRWTAYADGAPAAQLGGMGVSTPPGQVLAKAQANPDLAASSPASASRAVQLVTALEGVQR